MGAAGWHIALDVLDRWLGGAPIGRIVGMEAMKFNWGRLNEEYARQFSVKPMQPPALTRRTAPAHAALKRGRGPTLR